MWQFQLSPREIGRFRYFSIQKYYCEKSVKQHVTRLTRNAGGLLDPVFTRDSAEDLVGILISVVTGTTSGHYLIDFYVSLCP